MQGCGHASLSTNADTWHSKFVRVVYGICAYSRRHTVGGASADRVEPLQEGLGAVAGGQRPDVLGVEALDSVPPQQRADVPPEQLRQERPRPLRKGKRARAHAFGVEHGQHLAADSEIGCPISSHL